MQNKVEYARIIITQKCNLSCPYCHKEGIQNLEQQEMDMARTLDVIASLYRNGIRKFKLMGGEPTMYSELPALISGICQIGDDIDLSMISNGLFDAELMERCFSAGLQRINISVHAWDSVENCQLVGMTDTMLRLLKSNMTWLTSQGKLSKINYVFLKNHPLSELLSLAAWTDEHQCVLDVLNYLSAELDAYYYAVHASFHEIECFIRSSIMIKNTYFRENPYSLQSRRLVMQHGGEINLKVKPLHEAAPFVCCKECPYRKQCTEGICAIRLTKDGQIQPCLFRKDNCFVTQGIESGSVLDRSIEQFFSIL